MANGTGNGYDNGTLTDKIMDINEIPENRLSLDQLLLNLVNSGDEKHAKLALDLIDLNLIKGNESEKLYKNVESDTAVAINIGTLKLVIFMKWF